MNADESDRRISTDRERNQTEHSYWACPACRCNDSPRRPNSRAGATAAASTTTGPSPTPRSRRRWSYFDADWFAGAVGAWAGVAGEFSIEVRSAGRFDEQFELLG
jgi:hypothetical protein